jgi:hypothetical protein
MFNEILDLIVKSLTDCIVVIVPGALVVMIVR